MHSVEYIATKPFSEELFRTDIVASSATDFVKAFQSMSHFHSAVNLPKPCVKVESEVSLAGERYVDTVIRYIYRILRYTIIVQSTTYASTFKFKFTRILKSEISCLDIRMFHILCNCESLSLTRDIYIYIDIYSASS